MCASLEAPLKTVFCKPGGLKRVASRGWGQGRPGWTLVHTPGYENLFFSDFFLRNQMANKHWIPVPFHGIGTSLVRCKNAHFSG